jgi:thymidylate synthase (FAD)
MVTTTSKITVRLVRNMGSDDAVLEAMLASTTDPDAAAKKIDEMTPEAKYGRIKYLCTHRHGTPFEHSAVTVACHLPAFVWWEWVRHRIGMSYNLESGRYKVLEPVFWVPPRDRPCVPVADWKPSRPRFITFDDATWSKEAADEAHRQTVAELTDVYTKAYSTYERLIAEGKGIANEVARAALPFAIYYSGYVTTNPRSLMHFLSLRTHEPESLFVSYPQLEIEVAARACESMLASLWPLTHKAFNACRRVAP